MVKLLDQILASNALLPPRPRLVFKVDTVAAQVRRRYPDGCLPLARSFVRRAQGHPSPPVVEVPVPGTGFRLRASRFSVELDPLLWFSPCDPDWEHSVRITGHSGRESNEIDGGGLLRFGVRASFTKLRWSDYLARNATPPRMRDALAIMVIYDWLATDEATPLSNVHAIEVYYRGHWTSVADVTADEFEPGIETNAQGSMMPPARRSCRSWRW